MPLDIALWESAKEVGNYLATAPDSEFETIAVKSHQHNGFFEPQFVIKAIRAIANLLQAQSLDEAMLKYNFATPAPKKVGLILASNIPAVGFHDVLATLLMGHYALIKPGSGDEVLLFYLLKKWEEIYPPLSSLYEKADRLNHADAYIATGSDNAAMHFKYYLGKKPNIIRGNRTSVAILQGHESEDELRALGEDIFSYFGLGCRNVTQLLMPAGYDLSLLAQAWREYAFVINNHKYANNYTYQRTLAAMNGHLLLDGGFYLLKPGDALFAPVSIINIMEYGTNTEIMQWLSPRLNKIQCVVSHELPQINAIPFGQTQNPSLFDFADGIDTFDFLKKLHQSK